MPLMDWGKALCGASAAGDRSPNFLLVKPSL